MVIELMASFLNNYYVKSYYSIIFNSESYHCRDGPSLFPFDLTARLISSRPFCNNEMTIIWKGGGIVDKFIHRRSTIYTSKVIILHQYTQKYKQQ